MIGHLSQLRILTNGVEESQEPGRTMWRITFNEQTVAVHKLLASFAKTESGATAIEYALIAGGISIVIVAAVGAIGTTLSGTFTSVQNALK